MISDMLNKSFIILYNIKYIINGGNISTECVRNPLEWFYYGTDMLLINDSGEHGIATEIEVGIAFNWIKTILN